MPLIPYNHPFWEISKWFEEEGSLMKTPKMDIYEKNNDVVAEIELPGVDPKNIEVEVKDNVLKIEAKTEKKKEEKKKGYYRKELSQGYYKRAIPLPVEVVNEKASADYEDGILKVVVPKVKVKKKGKTKKVKVKTKK